MDPELEKLFRKLEMQREALLQLVQRQPEAVRNANNEGGWSINQILAHIVTSERLSILYIRKKSNAIETVDDTGIGEAVKMMLLVLSQRLPLKYKAPSFVKEHTPEASLPAIEESWAKVREELRQLLASIKPAHKKRKIYKHPVAGRLNIKQALKFFSEHIIHHKPQIKRLLS